MLQRVSVDLASGEMPKDAAGWTLLHSRPPQFLMPASSCQLALRSFIAVNMAPSLSEWGQRVSEKRHVLRRPPLAIGATFPTKPFPHLVIAVFNGRMSNEMFFSQKKARTRRLHHTVRRV